VARIIKNIEIEDQPAVALFDTDAVYAYVRSSLVCDVPRRVVTRPARVALGGKDIEIRELCLIEDKIEGLDFFGNAVPVDDIGRADGHELDVLIGALVMQQWRSGWIPRTGRWILKV